MYYPEEKKTITPLNILIKAGFVAGGLLIGLIISRIFIIPADIADRSMEPVLKMGDKLLFLKTASPNRGDIVLVKSPIEKGKTLIKRIAAAEGDTIEIKDGYIIINGKPVPAGYSAVKKDSRILPMYFTSRDNMPAVRLMRSEFFLLNDNLDLAYDSRWFGKTPADSIIGVMIYRRR